MASGSTARVTSAIAVALALAGCGTAAPPPESPEPAGAQRGEASLAPKQVREAARGAVEQYRQAYEVLTFEGLAPLYAQGPEVEVVAQGERYTGWDQVEAYLRDLLGRAREVRVRVSDLRVVALGPQSAVATAEIERSVRGPVTSVDAEGVLSLALRLDDGDWLIVNEHLSYTTDAN